MKTITVNVSEPVYRDFVRYGKAQGRPASELVREAMEKYHALVIRRETSLRDRRPIRVGGTVHPVGADEDLLEEMLDATRD